ncbi:DUF3742 family protein [Pseudomonas ogarae]
MSEKDRPSRAERLGERFGQCWKCYSHVLNKISHRLQRWGIPSALSRMAVWVMQGAAIAGLLYVAFWITLIAIIASLAASGFFSLATRANDFSADWRDGPSGFGLYDQTGVRIDPYDPDEMP